MTSYLIVLVVLFMLSTGVIFIPKYEKCFSYLATGILIMFAGLRFQTGYDWPAYELYFKTIVGMKEAICDGIPRLPFLAEPLYRLLNILVKSFTTNLTALFFIIAFINMSLMHYVLGKISRSIPFVWLLYFGIGFLIAQMTTIRQGLASTLVIIGLYLLSHKQTVKAVVLLIASLGFHVSAIIFAPIYFLQRFFPPNRVIFPAIFIGLICAASGINLQNYIFSLMTKIPWPWLTSKFSYYITEKSHPLSLGTIGLIFFHCILLFVFSVKTSKNERNLSVVKITVWLTLLILVAHLYFAGLPSVWNRVMLVTIPWQIATIFSLEWIKGLNLYVKQAILTGVFLLSGASLVYSLKKPDARPFLPYYSVVENMTSENKIDGRSRLTDFLVEKKGNISEDQLQAVGPRRFLFEPLMKNILDNYCKSD